MSNVAIFKTGQTPRYLKSINTPDYDKDPDVLINPDITAVKGLPIEHWKRDGNKIIEMSGVEKAALVTAKESMESDRISALNVTAQELAKGLISLGIVSSKNLITAIKGL